MKGTSGRPDVSWGLERRRLQLTHSGTIKPVEERRPKKSKAMAMDSVMVRARVPSMSDPNRAVATIWSVTWFGEKDGMAPGTKARRRCHGGATRLVKVQVQVPGLRQGAVPCCTPEVAQHAVCDRCHRRSIAVDRRLHSGPGQRPLPASSEGNRPPGTGASPSGMQGWRAASAASTPRRQRPGAPPQPGCCQGRRRCPP